MEFDSLLKKMVAQYEDQRPFTAFAIPNTTHLQLWLQQEEQVESTNCFETSGFVFAPFHSGTKTYCIRKDTAQVFTSQIPHKEVEFKTVESPFNISEKTGHIELVRSAVEYIKEEKASKIVISREKKIALKTAEITEIFKCLLAAYESAFRYMWFHPDTGLWCGASPELLLKTEGTEVHTTSLAGTQKHHPDKEAVWTQKEIEEQQIVTAALIKRLGELSREVISSEPYTHRAGSLVHIKTDVTGILKKSEIGLKKITEILHPTPAVCGTPRTTARKFILENEGYDRKFYTGFLGLTDEFDGFSQFYVNLRCMRIEDGNAYVYVGGGITSGSVPESEWEETQNKLQTMLQVLAPFL